MCNVTLALNGGPAALAGWRFICSTLFAHGNPPSFSTSAAPPRTFFSPEERRCVEGTGTAAAAACDGLGYDGAGAPPHWSSAGG
eukprot:gene4125-4509_t